MVSSLPLMTDTGTDTGSGTGDVKADSEDEGGCMAAGIPSILWLLLAGLAIRRRYLG